MPEHNHLTLSIIRKDLVSHDHDPKQEYRPHEAQREHGLPALADAALLQPGEGLEGLARGVAVEDGGVAVGRDAARGAPELDARDDEPDQPQHEEHEPADHDDGGEEAPLEDEPQQDHYEDYHEGGDGYVVGEVPAQEGAMVSECFGKAWGEDEGETQRRNNAGQTHHGTPKPNWPWIWTKLAKMPRMADEATSMKSIHRLSWMAGQWYLCRRSMRRS